MEESFAQLPVLHSFGVRLFDLFWRTHLHESRVCEFHFIRRGKLRLEFTDQSFEAGPGDIVIIPANTRHCDKFDPTREFEVFMASFSWGEAEKPFFARLPGPIIHVQNDEQRGRIRRTLEGLYLGANRDTDFDQLLCRSIFHTVLLSVMRLTTGQSPSTASAEEQLSAAEKKKHWLIAEVKRYINRNFQQQITLDDLSTSLGVSQYHLSRIFNEMSGFSLPEYLTMIRMEQAKVLLSEGRLNISQVAYQVGYEDSGYFSKVFKKHFGQSPSSVTLSQPARRV
jgi:AraC-like DNA-binding protein